MPIEPGTHTFGPDNATLTVKTGKGGAAAKAAHELVIEVTSWAARLDVGSDPAASTLALTADSRSLRVRSGSKGIGTLGDTEKSAIQQTIDEEVLEGTDIAFHSTAVTPGPDGLHVEGELDLRSRRHPLAFDLAVAGDGAITGSATVRQTEWGMKPYSTLFGTLKVADDVQVVIDAKPH